MWGVREGSQMPLRPWPEQWLCLIRKPEAGAGPGWWGRFRQVKPEVPDSQVEGLAFKGEVWAGGRHHQQVEAAESIRERVETEAQVRYSPQRSRR